MSAIIALIRQLLGLFVDDGSLAIAILAVVGVAALLSFAFHFPPLAVGASLALGCVLVLFENVWRAR
jgi:hypothetical protein